MPQLLEDGKNTIVVSHSDFGGVTQEFAPDEQDNVTRFYELRNATEQLGNLVQAHGSVSAAQATGADDVIRSVYFPLASAQNTQALGVGNFRPFCAYQFGGYVILGGDNGAGTPGWSLAWTLSSPPDLTSAWQQETPVLGNISMQSVRCFGMYGGNLYASGVAGTANNVQLLKCDLTTFPAAPCWTVIVTPIITGVAGARATTLVTFGDEFFAGTSQGVYVTDDPDNGPWVAVRGPLTTETYYLVLRPDLSALYAIGQTGIWVYAGDVWRRLSNPRGVPVALSPTGPVTSAATAPPYGMHAACWYVDSLVWLSDEGVPRVVRYAPSNVPDDAELDVAPVRVNVLANSLCAFRNDLYAFYYESGTPAVLFRRAYKAMFEVPADFTTLSVTAGAVATTYASLSGAECLYAWQSVLAASVTTSYIQPYRPGAIARLQDGTGRIVTPCLDTTTNLMRVIRLNASSSGYTEIATWPAVPVPSPQVSTVQFLGVQFYASEMFPLEQDDGGVFSATVVNAPAVAYINSKAPGAALTYVPRGRYAVVHADRLWLLNLAEDSNETVANAAQKPVAIRCCVPREVAYFNLPFFYGPAQLWLTNEIASLTNSAQQAANDTEITGGFSFRGRLYVTTSDAVWLIEQDQNGAPTGISLVTNTYGCTSHASITLGVNMVWWWSEVGPVVFDGQGIRSCLGSNRARQIINAAQLGTGERALSGFDSVHGQYYPQARQVLFWANAAGLPWQNTCVAIDVDTEELSLFYPQSDGDASERGLSATCSGTLENEDDTSTIYIAHVNGALYQVTRAGDNDTHPIDMLVRTQALGSKQPGQRFRSSEFALRARVNDSPVPYRAVLWPVANGEVSPQPVYMPNTLDQVLPNNGFIEDGDFVSLIETTPNQGVFGTDGAWQMRVRSTQPVEIASLTEKWAVEEDRGNLGGRGGG